MKALKKLCCTLLVSLIYTPNTMCQVLGVHIKTK